MDDNERRTTASIRIRWYPVSRALLFLALVGTVTYGALVGAGVQMLPAPLNELLFVAINGAAIWSLVQDKAEESKDRDHEAADQNLSLRAEVQSLSVELGAFRTWAEEAEIRADARHDHLIHLIHLARMNDPAADDPTVASVPMMTSGAPLPREGGQQQQGRVQGRRRQPRRRPSKPDPKDEPTISGQVVDETWKAYNAGLYDRPWPDDSPVA